MPGSPSSWSPGCAGGRRKSRSPRRRSRVPVDEATAEPDEAFVPVVPSPEPLTSRERRRSHDRSTKIRVYELAVTVPVVAYLVWQIVSDPQPFTEWQLYVWTVAVAVAELLPVPTNVSMRFSLSFPLELSAAMLFPTPAAAMIAFLGSTDARELRGEMPPLKAL